MTLPMLGDFALRVACGLAILLLLTSRRDVPPQFFRTNCLVILGLLVLVTLDTARSGVRGPLLFTLIGGAVLSYLAAVCWGLGAARLGVPLVGLIALGGAVALVATSLHEPWPLGMLSGAGRLASAFLVGANLTAMLLGHHYLTAPAMSIEPLEGLIRCVGWGLGARALLATVGLWLLSTMASGSAGDATSIPLFLAIRWGMGIVGPAVAAILAWKTVQIRSTQSATGILFIGLILVLFGELTALVLSREVGVLL